MKEKYKYNSVQRKISSLKSYYKFLYVNKYISTDPTNTVKAMKKKKKIARYTNRGRIKKNNRYI